jgi:hypothetical protein
MRPAPSACRDGVGRPLQVTRSKRDLNLYKIILALWKEQELSPKSKIKPPLRPSSPSNTE